MSYSISGNVGIAGALVSYSGADSGEVTSDAQGDFIIPSLEDGLYIITPSLEDHDFIPVSQAVGVFGGNVSGVNFIAPNSRSWLTVQTNNFLRGVRH
jgi:hypothetical protein